MKRAIVTATLCLTAIAPPAIACSNALTSFPLHAVPTSGTADCEVEPDPCDPGPPMIDVESGTTVAVYVMARNYEEISGLQTAFEWGDWQFLFGLWSCRPNQIVSHVPQEAGGAADGTITAVFDCIESGRTAVIGIMHFVVGGGCLRQVESSLPFGTHVLNGDATEACPITEVGWGMICAGYGGYDACEPVVPSGAPTPPAGRSPLLDMAPLVECVSPVAPASWGALKNVYH